MKILFKMKLQTDLNTEMDVNLILVSLFQFVEFSVIGGNIQGKFQVIRSWWIVWIQMLCKADSLNPSAMAWRIISAVGVPESAENSECMWQSHKTPGELESIFIITSL